MSGEKHLCRHCGEEIRKSGDTYRHVKSDNGRCEALRRVQTGDARTPIEPA